jgi:hypothetical protein
VVSAFGRTVGRPEPRKRDARPKVRVVHHVIDRGIRAYAGLGNAHCDIA